MTYSATVSERDDAARRLTQLRRVTAELASAQDLATVIEIVVAHAADALDASVATMSLLTDPDTLTMVGIRGGQPETGERWATYPIDADVPASEAVRTRQPVAVVGRAAIEARYPSLVGQIPTERSVVCLPLIAGERAVGVIGLTFEGTHVPDAHQSEFVELFADTCAQAIVRVEAVTAASDTSAKLEFLADAAVELASSLDYRATLSNVARLVVESLGDWCAVEILDDGVLHTVAVAHVDPAKVEWARELQRRYPSDPDAPTGSPNVVRTGASELYPEITDEMLVAGARDEEHLQLARDLRLRSAMIVPLTARGRMLGAITIIAAESGRRYGPADLSVAEDLGRRAAMAIDNANLYSETRQAAQRLQQAVLPDSRPAVPGWDVAVHYSAAGRTDVGGDFYDVLPQPGDRIVVVVGDVMGRGVAAAAAMAQMRAAVRAYAASDPDPAEVMTRLDGMFLRYAQTQLVTLVYALLDPAGGTISLANAGHLPPVVVGLDARAEVLEKALQPPLGVSVPTRSARTFPMPVGATLLIYTDGLVERRDEDIDDSVQRLVERAGRLLSGDLQTALDELVEGVQDADRNDDVTAVAVRRCGS
ncbi:MAG: Serine phosphatase RsbU, regulator of sigma subunit [Pseudonocardiales bacterium]|nr:Serine phosphatase RsbU, regulator of sigma subunit [Pseudonocardiales bacterium]